MASASTSRSLLGMPLRTTLRSASRELRRSSNIRSLHSLPPLPVNLSEEKGCSPLFSSTAVKLLWNDWQGGLLNKLNDEVRGTQWESSSIVETVIGTSRDPSKIQAFNFASLALNNSFFLSNLKGKILPANVTHWEDAAPPKPSIKLMEAINANFESLPAFKLAFSSMAYGMSGSGYVWFVRDRNGNLGVVPTYGAGTILVQNRTQRNGARMEWNQPSLVETSAPPPASPRPNSSLPPSARLQQQQQQQQPPSSRLMSTSSKVQFASSSINMRGARLAEGAGEELFPLLCVSVHERDWLPDYGMWGKEEYLMRFWECVDWARVNHLWETYGAEN
ncbi:hypothetical protein CBS101457_003477 [Exobasidium rhododendri]|nr:hypothetical protein CBS101457_003477 [Exobasidium rhododendri]